MEGGRSTRFPPQRNQLQEITVPQRQRKLEPIIVPERERNMADPLMKNIANMLDTPEIKSVEGGSTNPRPKAPGLLSGLARGALDYLADPVNRKTLAIGLQGMSLNPDRGFQAALQSQIDDIQEERKTYQGRNQTLQFLKSQNVPQDVLDAIEGDPTLLNAVAGEAIKDMYTKKTTTLMTGAQINKLYPTAKVPDSGIYNVDANGKYTYVGGDRENEDVFTQYGLKGKTVEFLNQNRKEFDALDTTKNYKESAAALARMTAASGLGTGAGDLALIFGYMKVLDPRSTVREGEFASAANAGGVVENLRNQYNRVLDGELLTPKVRATFIQSANALFEKQQREFSRLKESYRNRAVQLLPADKSAAADVFFDADYGYSNEDIERNREELEGLTLEEMTARFGGAPKPETGDDGNNNDGPPSLEELEEELARRNKQSVRAQRGR